jgi:DNA repair exonuclease SbcCD ATPase subunit
MMGFIERQKQLDKRISEIVGKHLLLSDQKNNASLQLKEDKRALQVHLKVLEIFQEISILVQDNFVYHVTSTANMALALMFDDGYKIRMDFEVKRSQSEAKIDLVQGDSEHGINPVDASGGGLVDILSMTFRVALWSLQKESTRPILVLDEPMKFVDEERQVIGSQVIKEISERLGLQFIIVSHKDVLIESASKAFRVNKRKGVSNVKSIN